MSDGSLSAKAVEGAEILKPKEILKEELRDSECCRFCGIGSSTQVVSASFVPIFENINEAIGETLDLVINRYLPIKVLKSDPLYPRVICTDCYECLKETIEFFDKICKGQKVLAKILNQYPPLKVENSKGKVDLQFSEINPVLKAPKRRGRPRKCPSQQINASDLTPSSEIQEITETRTKRQSRPPIRYMDDTLKKECLNNEECSEDTILHVETLSTNIYEDKHVETSSGVIRSLNMRASPAGNTQRLIRPEGSEGDNKEGGFGFNNVTNALNLIEDAIKSEENPEVVDELVSEYSDGDKSVKLSDLVGRKKKPIKRKRKYKKRVLNPKCKIQCQQCTKTFNHPSSLVYHRLSVHDHIKNFICGVCDRAFSHKQLLTNHMFVHSNEKSFVCNSCPAKFKSRASLYTHKKSIHSATREFTCDKCGFQFNLKSSLKAHMRIHTKEKPFLCEYCQKAFAQRSSLREHRRIHTGERPYVCSECMKSFTTASQLRSHKFSHTDQKNHLCQICGKGFSHSENFKYHMRRHSGERPLECHVCKKQFTEPWSLKKHFRLHSGEKPYKCDQCPKVFADPSNFAKHKKLHLNIVLEPKIENTKPDHQISTLIGKTLSLDEQPEGPDGASDMVVESSHPDAPSIVQILKSEGLVYESVDHDGEQEVEQVIYVLSDDSPLFALSMSNSQQQSELKAESLSGVGGFNQSMDALDVHVPFTTEHTGEFESHYYSLETVDGTTVAVPITITPGTAFDVSNSRSAESSPVAIETEEFKASTE